MSGLDNLNKPKNIDPKESALGRGIEDTEQEIIKLQKLLGMAQEGLENYISHAPRGPEYPRTLIDHQAGVAHFEALTANAVSKYQRLVDERDAHVRGNNTVQ